MARDEKLDLLQRIPLFSGFDRRRMERLGMLADGLGLGQDDRDTLLGAASSPDATDGTPWQVRPERHLPGKLSHE